MVPGWAWEHSDGPNLSDNKDYLVDNQCKLKDCLTGGKILSSSQTPDRLSGKWESENARLAGLSQHENNARCRCKRWDWHQFFKFNSLFIKFVRPFHPHTNYCPRIISPNSLSGHCVGQKLSDILMSAPKNGPSHRAQHGAWQGLYKVMWNPQTSAHFPRIFTQPFTAHRI